LRLGLTSSSLSVTTGGHGMNSSLRIALVANTLALIAGSGSALARASAAGENQQDGKSSVTVHILRNAEVPIPTLFRAEAVAREMFAKAGVNLNLQTRKPKLDAVEERIVVDITSRGPKFLHRAALAYAAEFEGVHITVFYDRVKDAACGSATEFVGPCARSSLPMLLAHVLVHEITHILEGIDRHSREGVMKAHWTTGDIAGMARKPLPFDRSDIELIHSGVARRETARKVTVALGR